MADVGGVTEERVEARGSGAGEGVRTVRRRSRPGAAVQGAPVLLFGVLLLIAGVLAMHSLAGGHHRSATVDLTAHTAVPAAPGHEHSSPAAHSAAEFAQTDESMVDAQAGVAGAAGAVVAVAVAGSQCGASECEGHSAGAQAVCLAVLTGLALLLAAVGLVALGTRLPSVAGHAPVTAAFTAVRPPSLVQLCVSRT